MFRYFTIQRPEGKQTACSGFSPPQEACKQCTIIIWLQSSMLPELKIITCYLKLLK